MKQLPIIASAFLGVVIAASPIAAFANDSDDDSVDASVSASASASVELDDDSNDDVGDDSKGRNDDLLRRKIDMIERAQKERRDVQERFREGLHGSTTKARLASSSDDRKERFENSGRGVDPAKVQAHGAEKIDERIKKMQEQIARIAKMERLGADQKASITAELNAQIASLTALKASIGTETDPAKIKELTKSITKEYRVYAVTMPKAAITAASDRIMKVVAQMESFMVKLDARVTASGSAEASTALADYKAKVADAKVQAQAAATLVAGLQADNGDATVAASNTAALKSAKEKIDLAQKDLKDARKDIGVILKAVKGTGDDSAS